MQIGLPGFRGMVRNLIIVSAAIYVVIILLWAGYRPAASKILEIGTLSPPYVFFKGWVWQFLTYGFVALDPRQFLYPMIGIFFLGSSVEARIGSRSFLELYLASLTSAGVLGFLFSLSGVVGRGDVLGAGAAANAVLMVFYLLNRDAPIMLFPLPVPIPVKYIVMGFAALEGAYFILSEFSLYYLVLLMGFVSGYGWYRFMWRRANILGRIGGLITDMRNGYYRWKRRKAAKKFEVYMRKHEKEPGKYFDEYGNFKPPEDAGKKDGGKGGWVN